MRVNFRNLKTKDKVELLQHLTRSAMVDLSKLSQNIDETLVKTF
jgi:hypothetical protein